MSDITDFLNSKAYSQCTIESYRRLLGLAEREIGDLLRLTPEQLRYWLYKHNDWGDNHRWVAYCAIRSYLRWRCGDSHPALNLKIKRRDTAPQRFLGDDSVVKILESFNTATPKGKRDLAIFCVLLDTGLRCSEVCNLEIKYLDLDACHLFVIIKGGKWGNATFSDYTRQVLIAWLAERKRIVSKSFRYVFCSVGGNTPGNKLTRDGLKVIVRGWAKNAGLSKLSPHDLRRTFAIMTTRNGAPSRIVQIAGRWSSIEMVERYTRGLTIDDIKPYLPIPRLVGLD